MRGRGLGLALVSLALALPATASAAPKAAKVAEDYKVLVVTSAQDPVSTAGVSAIQAAGTSGGFTVTAPTPATVGEQFTAANLEQYRRGRVPGHGPGQPADRRPAQRVRGLLP